MGHQGRPVDPRRHAVPRVPRQDWCRLQRHEDVGGRGSDQGGAEPPAPQAPPRACGARAEVAVQRALPEACPENDAIKNEAKKKGQKANVKRVPPGPRPGKLVSGEVCVLEAQPYTENYF